MKTNYRTEAEWMAAFNALMASRTSASEPVSTKTSLLHHAAPTLQRKPITGAQLARTRPLPIKRTP